MLVPWIGHALSSHWTLLTVAHYSSHYSMNPVTAKRHTGTFSDFGDILCVERDGSYPIVHIKAHQTVHLKSNFIICKHIIIKLIFLNLKIIKKYGKTLEICLDLKVTSDKRYPWLGASSAELAALVK